MRTLARVSLLGLAAFGVLLVAGPAGAGISTERVSVASDGSQANERSMWPAITPDGRYVAFSSYASNLVDSDGNGRIDVFVHDRYTHVTERVSVDGDGTEGNGASGTWGPAISSDGNVVAFDSAATNLVPDDTNGKADIFVHDRSTGITKRVSVDSSGNQANGFNGWGPAVSGDGRYVAFVSSATNLVAEDTNGKDDIFVHDRSTGVTERVSVDSAGNQANNYSGFLGIAINDDGRYVAFDSMATNLVPNDTNSVGDIFLHDRTMHTTERVSVDSAGNQADGWSDVEAISRDGMHIAFASVASNLVPNDTNTCPGWSPSCLDVFIHDRDTGVTERISVNSSENEANKESLCPSISGDLRYVAFLSEATNLVPDDTNGFGDVFLRDRQRGTTKLISVSSDGEQGNNSSIGTRVAMGLDDVSVAYDSFASNLVPGDTNGVDIFLDPPQADPPAGGIAELPDVASDSGWSTGTYAALAGGLAAAVPALSAGAWCARRRWFK